MNDFIKTVEDKDIFEKITETKDLYYVALIILAMCEKSHKYASSSELAMILDKENFLRLLDVYGGQTIYIPKKSDILGFIEALITYYMVNIQGKSKAAVIKELGIKDKERLAKNMKYVKSKLKLLSVPE